MPIVHGSPIGRILHEAPHLFVGLSAESFPWEVLKVTTSYRAYVQQLVHSTKGVKSAASHNGSKRHCVLQIKIFCEQKIV